MTVINNATLILKDSQGNEGVVKSFTDNDIDKISSAITDVGKVVDPATHMPIEATKTSAGVVQLATAQDITNGTASKVVDAQELNNFAQTLPAANGVTDVSSGDNSNQLVVSRIGGSKTLTIDNVEHADNADEATHATQADTATSADSVAWGNVQDKPSSFTPASHTHDDRYYTESEIDTKLSGKSDITHNHNSTYLGISAKAESSKSADSVAWNNVSGKPSSYTPSSHTHDDRYYTESEIDTKLGGKANTSGALFTVNGLAKPGWSKIGTGEGGSCIQVKTTDNTYPSICFHRSGHSHCVLAESSGQLGTMQEGNGTFNHLITSANIGSQSVNYANSAGSVAWNNVSGKPSFATVATSGSYSDLSNKPTIPSNTNQLTNGAGYITSSSNITGNAATATKLATARSISAGDLEFQGSANFDGSGNIKLNITHHRSLVTIGNTNNYPFHRIAYTAVETGSYLDRVITFFIGREYLGGGYGICRITLRTNDAAKAATAQCEVQWLVRTSGIPVDAIQVGFNNTAAASYVDVFYKSSGSYHSAICRVISHASSRSSVGQGFTVVSTSSEANNTTTSNPLTSTESYATIAAAGTKIRGKAYTSTIIASDAGNVNYANSAGSVAWSNVSGRPTKVSQFTNDSGYITGITKAMVTNALGYTPPTKDTNTWNALKGSTTSAAGTAGYAPAPAAGAANRYLRCDGTWQVPPDNNTTYSVATTSANGLMSSSDKTKLNKCVTTDSIWIG